MNNSVQRKRVTWTEEEDNYLRQNQNLISRSEAAVHLGKTREQVTSRIKSLGLEWTSRSVFWSKADDDWLRNNAGQVTRDFAAKHLGKTLSQVKTRISFLDIVWDDHHIYTAAEDEWLRQIAGNISHKEAAAQLCVTINSLRGRIRKLELEWRERAVFSGEDDQWLKENAGKVTYKQAANKLGKTEEQTRWRTRSLGIQWSDTETVDIETLDIPSEWKKLPSTAKEASEKGIKRYFTGRPCANGHLSPRQASSKNCMECARERVLQKYYANHEESKIKGKEHQRKRMEDGRRQVYWETVGREKAKQRERIREQTDLNYYLGRRLRTRSKNAIKKATGERGLYKSDELHGCDIKFMRQHIENQFLEGMHWGNHASGSKGWHIDEIRPVSTFDLSNRNQQLICFNWRNRQPLWGSDNISKSNNWTPDMEREWAEKMRKLRWNGDLFLVYPENP